MPFNLYFAGNCSGKGKDYIIAHNLPKLLLQNTERKAILEYIDKGFKGKLFIDSGAYTAHTKGKKVNCDDYIEFLNQYSSHFECYAQLDEIPGEYQKKKTAEQLMGAPERSWENFLYMYERVHDKEKILPIFHQGEDFYHLSRMLEWTDENGEHIKYIGISPANDLATSKKIPWISQCFWIIQNSSNPNVKTHAFGMTALDVLERYPFYSADSTTYLRASAMGEFMSPYGRLYYNHRHSGYSANEIELHRKFVERMGCDYDLAISNKPGSQDERMLISIKYLHEWSTNYEYKGNNKFQRPLFFRKYKNE